MLSFDTNIADYAANSASPFRTKAVSFIQSPLVWKDVAICELVLVELYLKLRIFPSAQRREGCGCMPVLPEKQIVAAHRIGTRDGRSLAAGRSRSVCLPSDQRLALALRHHGVTEFATTNEKDFQSAGFSRIWNPLPILWLVYSSCDGSSRAIGTSQLQTALICLVSYGRGMEERD